MRTISSIATQLLTIAAMLQASPGQAELPLFPEDKPSEWVCSKPEPTQAELEDWCAANVGQGKPAQLPPPADIDNLPAKNHYDTALTKFARSYGYRELGWAADKSWRFTGPYVGEFGEGQSYGVHPAVRMWYSPEMVSWMCNGREGDIDDGAIIIKEMFDIRSSSDFEELGVNEDSPCMEVTADPADVDPTSWTIMVRYNNQSWDGWYWGNPAGSGYGNPPICDMSAVTSKDFFGENNPGDCRTQAPPPQEGIERNPQWYPTGDLFGDGGNLADIITPYSEFGAYCMNCHASAESHLTFSSLSNILTDGMLFKHFAEDPTPPSSLGVSGAEHVREVEDDGNKNDPRHWGFTVARDSAATGFTERFGNLGPLAFKDALGLRLPAETFDHAIVSAEGPDGFLTSDQCIGCHDATVSNASTPNMLITDEETGKHINVSPYAGWRASPMGLAGRDPIFFSQLESETNNLPHMTECIENTCLHCHGVM